MLLLRTRLMETCSSTAISLYTANTFCSIMLWLVEVSLHRKFFHSYYSHQILHEEVPDQENRKQREGAWCVGRKGQAILFCSICSWNHWCIMGLFENIFCLTLLYHCYLSCVCRFNMIILRQVPAVGWCDGSERLKWWHHTLSKIATLSKPTLSKTVLL